MPTFNCVFARLVHIPNITSENGTLSVRRSRWFAACGEDLWDAESVDAQVARLRQVAQPLGNIEYLVGPYSTMKPETWDEAATLGDDAPRIDFKIMMMLPDDNEVFCTHIDFKAYGNMIAATTGLAELVKNAVDPGIRYFIVPMVA